MYASAPGQSADYACVARACGAGGMASETVEACPVSADIETRRRNRVDAGKCFSTALEP